MQANRQGRGANRRKWKEFSKEDQRRLLDGAVKFITELKKEPPHRVMKTRIEVSITFHKMWLAGFMYGRDVKAFKEDLLTQANHLLVGVSPYPVRVKFYNDMERGRNAFWIHVTENQDSYPYVRVKPVRGARTRSINAVVRSAIDITIQAWSRP